MRVIEYFQISTTLKTKKVFQSFQQQILKTSLLLSKLKPLKATERHRPTPSSNPIPSHSG